MAQRIDCKPTAIVTFVAAALSLMGGESVAAPHQLECSVTTHYDQRGQRAETRSIKFVYEDRESALYTVDDDGRIARCANSVVGTLEIMGACGSVSVWISKSTHQLELNSFDYRWNARRRINEEAWAYGEKGSCREIDSPAQ